MPTRPFTLSRGALFPSRLFQKNFATSKIGFSVCLLGGDALITRARNTIVTQFLDTPAATHLLFIDADIGFSPEAALRLLRSGYPVVAGVYPAKTLNWAEITRRASDPTCPLPESALQYVVDFGPPVHSTRTRRKVTSRAPSTLIPFPTVSCTARSSLASERASKSGSRGSGWPRPCSDHRGSLPCLRVLASSAGRRQSVRAFRVANGWVVRGPGRPAPR